MRIFGRVIIYPPFFFEFKINGKYVSTSVRKWYNLNVKIILVLIMFLTTLPVGAEVLKGGVVYTVETAREAAFKGMEYEISMEPYKEYMTDPGFIAAGKDGGKPRVSKAGRRINYFMYDGYGVRYNNKKDVIYYYDNNGVLDGIEFRPLSYSYPYINKMYDNKGNILFIFFKENSKSVFIYDTNKKLIGHWIDNICYDEKGKIVNKRFR